METFVTIYFVVIRTRKKSNGWAWIIEKKLGLEVNNDKKDNKVKYRLEESIVWDKNERWTNHRKKCRKVGCRK